MKGRSGTTRDRRSYFVFLIGICAGLGGGLAITHAEQHKWCLVLSEDFSGNLLNSSTWQVEQRVGGGESGDFTWFTDHNAYMDNGKYFIIPSLTNETLLPTDYADWLWPQITLVPATEEYGAYPGSGLISIFESRGNQAKYRLDQLNNEMVCGLHWGPAGEATYDRFFRTQGLYKGYDTILEQRSFVVAILANRHEDTRSRIGN
ncbi:hypothetical protein EMMF5_006525 [Cystobasidiomycetes sp. EMM_F5]